ncbi:MAG: hypothetical protein M3N51_12160 [Actinomycetota bacterium]|nr:hypothetical protein [Actinomycetota bacterium]
MNEARRIRIGILGVVFGLLIVALGVAIAHFAGLPARDPISQVPILPWVPRGWLFVTAGQIVALVGSQAAIAAFVYAWVMDRPMTWARAALAAFIATFELVLFFGIVPSEWLNLTQGPLAWTSQKQAFAIPRWLVLNNEVVISYSAIKDAVSGTYNALALGAVIVGAYKFQERGKEPPPPPPPRTSPYGRPLVRTD